MSQRKLVRWGDRQQQGASASLSLHLVLGFCRALRLPLDVLGAVGAATNKCLHMVDDISVARPLCRAGGWTWVLRLEICLGVLAALGPGVQQWGHG